MKKVLIILVVLVVLGGAVAAALVMRDDNNQTQETEPTDNQTNQQSTTVEQNQQNSTQSGQVSVSISNFSFPDIIRVTKGTKVTWTNQDSTEHNVVSDPNSPQGGLNGPLLAQGESFSFTFDTVGTYNYHCAPHPSMTATVEVVE